MILQQTRPVSRSAGFGQDGFYVWGGTAEQRPDGWVLLASRWPRNAEKSGRSELDGYRTSSEIVRAVSDTVEGPYIFDGVLLGKRREGYWDSRMTHNPFLYCHDNRHYLFYIGSRGDDPARRIGCARLSDTLSSAQRPDGEIILTGDANNPAPYQLPDGRTAVMFRDRTLRVCIAAADSPEDRFEIVAEDIFPGVKLEDFCVYPFGSGYRMICEDNTGAVTGSVRWGAAFHSSDGITGWTAADEPVYDHTIHLDDGSIMNVLRRERPQLLFDESGRTSHLITSALTHEGSRCMVVPVKESPAT